MDNVAYNDIKSSLMNLSDASLDASMIELIKNWSIPFKAIEILEVLDKSIFSSLASGTIIVLLQALLDESLKNENITHEKLVKNAYWRE